MIEITFKRYWIKIAPFGNYASRVESEFWFKGLNYLEIQNLNQGNDSKVESDY